MGDQPEYRSYLLRLWHTPGAHGNEWRASLEDPHTAIRLGFSSIERLHQFLLDQLSGGSPEQHSPAAPPRAQPQGDAEAS